MLDVRRLAVFHAVADHGSFSAAALALDYTQSVVSHHVAQLERELGVSLFERGRRPVRLTPAGERLDVHARAILGAVRTAEDEMRALAGMETGTLRVGAFLSACATFVPAAIGRFAREHPDVDVRLEQREPEAALPRLVAGELDLIVTRVEYHERGEEDARLEQAPLGDDPYRVVLPPGHRLARRRELTMTDLSGERFLAPRAVRGGVAYRELLAQLGAEAGFTPDVVFEVDDVTVARTFVAAGLAVAIMPELTVPRPRPDVVVKPLAGVDPFRRVSAQWMRGRRAPGIPAMVDALRHASRPVVG